MLLEAWALLILCFCNTLAFASNQKSFTSVHVRVCGDGTKEIWDEHMLLHADTLLLLIFLLHHRFLFHQKEYAKLPMCESVELWSNVAQAAVKFPAFWTPRLSFHYYTLIFTM